MYAAAMIRQQLETDQKSKPQSPRQSKQAIFCLTLHVGAQLLTDEVWRDEVWRALTSDLAL